MQCDDSALTDEREERKKSQLIQEQNINLAQILNILQIILKMLLFVIREDLVIFTLKHILMNQCHTIVIHHPLELEFVQKLLIFQKLIYISSSHIKTI